MQRCLFGHGEPAFDARMRRAERFELGKGAWLEYLPGWLQGHSELFDALVRSADWHREQRRMYEREVEVPRLMARAPRDSSATPVLRGMSYALSERYHLELNHLTLAWYRNGADSVAPHGDKLGSLTDNTVVAIVSLGEPRRFTLRPAEGGATRFLRPGYGDLVVMGGTCQRTFLHAIPKQGQAGPRMAVMFRPEVPWERSAGPGRALNPPGM